MYKRQQVIIFFAKLQPQVSWRLSIVNSEIIPTLSLPSLQALLFLQDPHLLISTNLLPLSLSLHHILVRILASTAKIIPSSTYNISFWSLNLRRNIVIGSQGVALGFIGYMLSRTNVTFEDFSVRNITFLGETPFLSLYQSSSAFADTPNSISGLILRNGVVEDLFDDSPHPLPSNVQPINSLFLQSSGPTQLTIRNLTATNIRLKSLFSSCLIISNFC